MNIHSFSVAILMGISQLIQVHSIPGEPSKVWTVTKPWQRGTHGFELEAQSNALPELCRANPGAYVSFPSVIHGAHEVFLDGLKIAEFGDKTFASLRSFYGALVLSCDQVANGHSVTWKVYSYSQYFARIMHYPLLTPRPLLQNVFSESLNIIAAGSLFILAFLSFLLFGGRLSNRLVLSITLSNLFFSIYFLGAVAGFANIPLSMLVTHKIADLGIWLGAASFFNVVRLSGLISLRIYRAFLLNIAVAMIIILFGQTGDTIQFGTTLPFALTLYIFAYCAYSLLLRLVTNRYSNQSLFSFLSLFTFLVGAAHEMFVVIGISPGYTVFNIGIVGGLVFFVLTLNESISQTYRERDYLRLNLEKEVITKTEELHNKNKTLDSMLNGMRQAIFSIDKNFRVVAPVSRFCLELFGEPIEGKNIYSTLFRGFAAQSEEFSKLTSLFTTVFGEDDIQWMLAESSLPGRVQLGTKVLRVDYRPLWNQDNQLEHIMFVVEDITRILELQTQIETNGREVRILQQLLSHPRDEILSYISSIKQTGDQIDKLAETGAEPSSGDIKGILRQLHTAKGNSRLFGMEELSGYLHEREGTLLSLSAGSKPLLAELRSAAAKIREFVATFDGAAKKLFEVRQEEYEDLYVSVLKRYYLHIKELFSRITRERKMTVQELYYGLERIQHASVKSAMARMKILVDQISKQLGKDVRFEIEGEDFTLPQENIQKLVQSASHLIRNAVDHGIEAESERLRSGKPIVGRLRFKLGSDADGDFIDISDDGRGISPDHVASVGISKGIILPEGAARLTAQEKLEMIFIPSFSTRTETTEISGRGIGMDVVKNHVESMGGMISVRSVEGEGTTFRLTFRRTLSARPTAEDTTLQWS